jgi:glycerol uptake facilitator protein
MAQRLKIRGLPGEMIAEFFGTMVLILFGVGVVAQVVGAALGAHDSISWAWGLGVTFGIYTAGRISGAHLNPAVTLTLAVFKGFPWKKVAPYALAQTAGAFIAALLVRWDYSAVLNMVDPHHTFKTQGVFSTLPGDGAFPVSIWGAFRDQIIGTAILLFLILAITDVRNANPAVANLTPFIIGLVVVAIGMAWGTDAGYAINPARDFGPRLAEYFTGYHTAFKDQYGGLYFWVPIVAPLIGGVVGGALYEGVLARALPWHGPQEVGEVPDAPAADEPAADAASSANSANAVETA